MRFKLDVSDRETGEVGSVEVEAPTAQAARQHMRDAGYMVWATEPAACADPPQERGRRHRPARNKATGPLMEQAQEGTFRAHPVRFVMSPLLRFLGAILAYSAILFALLVAKGFPLPHGPVLSGQNLLGAGCLVWLAGWWIGRPVARGRGAQRALADAEMVCRYCRRRGHVSTQQRGVLRRRLWGHCTNCGIRWTL